MNMSRDSDTVGAGLVAGGGAAYLFEFIAVGVVVAVVKATLPASTLWRWFMGPPVFGSSVVSDGFLIDNSMK